MSDLKPCPYCGGEAKLFEGEECAYVQCLSVKIHRGPFVDGDNDAPHEAIAAWNARTVDPAPAKQVTFSEAEAIREAALRAAAALVASCAWNEYWVCDGEYMEPLHLSDRILALLDKPAPDHSAGAGNMIDKGAG